MAEYRKLTEDEVINLGNVLQARKQKVKPHRLTAFQEYVKEYYQKGAATVILQFSSEYNDDQLERMFGDDCQVTVAREGEIEVGGYEHD